MARLFRFLGTCTSKYKGIAYFDFNVANYMSNSLEINLLWFSENLTVRSVAKVNMFEILFYYRQNHNRAHTTIIIILFGIS